MCERVSVWCRSPRAANGFWHEDNRVCWLYYVVDKMCFVVEATDPTKAAQSGPTGCVFDADTGTLQTATYTTTGDGQSVDYKHVKVTVRSAADPWIHVRACIMPCLRLITALPAHLRPTRLFCVLPGWLLGWLVWLACWACLFGLRVCLLACLIGLLAGCGDYARSLCVWQGRTPGEARRWYLFGGGIPVLRHPHRRDHRVGAQVAQDATRPRCVAHPQPAAASPLTLVCARHRSDASTAVQRR